MPGSTPPAPAQQQGRKPRGPYEVIVGNFGGQPPKRHYSSQHLADTKTESGTGRQHQPAGARTQGERPATRVAQPGTADAHRRARRGGRAAGRAAPPHGAAGGRGARVGRPWRGGYPAGRRWRRRLGSRRCPPPPTPPRRRRRRPPTRRREGWPPPPPRRAPPCRRRARHPRLRLWATPAARTGGGGESGRPPPRRRRPRRPRRRDGCRPTAAAAAAANDPRAARTTRSRMAKTGCRPARAVGVEGRGSGAQKKHKAAAVPPAQQSSPQSHWLRRRCRCPLRRANGRTGERRGARGAASTPANARPRQGRRRADRRRCDSTMLSLPTAHGGHHPAPTVSAVAAVAARRRGDHLARP